MTYKEFKEKYNGKYTDFDGYYGCQCWDLAQRYITEVLQLPSSILSGCGLVSNMLYQPKRQDLDAYFDEVSIYDMQQGDICIWEYGHIAIFDNWDGNACWYFSQNPNPCQVMQVNANGLHAFRMKNTSINPKNYINIPAWIDERYIYDVDTKEKLPYTLKPSKFGGLSYLIHSFKDDKYFAEIETRDYGHVLVRITTPTKITQSPLYEHGNY